MNLKLLLKRCKNQISCCGSRYLVIGLFDDWINPDVNSLLIPGCEVVEGAPADGKGKSENPWWVGISRCCPRVWKARNIPQQRVPMGWSLRAFWWGSRARRPTPHVLPPWGTRDLEEEGEVENRAWAEGDSEQRQPLFRRGRCFWWRPSGKGCLSDALFGKASAMEWIFTDVLVTFSCPIRGNSWSSEFLDFSSLSFFLYITQGGTKVSLQLWVHKTQSLFLYYYLGITVYFPYEQP